MRHILFKISIWFKILREKLSTIQKILLSIVVFFGLFWIPLIDGSAYGLYTRLIFLFFGFPSLIFIFLLFGKTK